MVKENSYMNVAFVSARKIFGDDLFSYYHWGHSGEYAPQFF
jgi:hypothetical protein